MNTHVDQTKVALIENQRYKFVDSLQQIAKHELLELDNLGLLIELVFFPFVHFIDGFFLAHVYKMQIGGHDDLGVAIGQVGFDPKVADVIELDFFLVVFNNKMFGNKS